LSYKPSKELNRLCSAAAEGCLDSAGAARLNALVRNDDQARRFYVDYLEVHALLQWRHGGVEPLELPLAGVAVKEPPRRRARYAWAGVAAVACAAVVAFVLFAVSGYAPWRPGEAPARPLAIVLDEEDVRWQADAVLDGEQQLRPGRQRIEAGVARIELANGVLLAAAGPCDFEITAADRLHLHRGKVHVYSPLATRGFTVTTPRGVQIVDLGTRFGVWCDDDDNVHVHLFEGRLEINGQEELEAGGATTVDTRGESRSGDSDEALFPSLHR